jgi:hypothetical protein
MRELIAGAIALCFLLSAQAHDSNAPELDDWYKSLESEAGTTCCDGSDAFSVLDPDWDTEGPNGSYRVRLDGVWHNVPSSSVVQNPNKSGVAKVWPVSYRDGHVIIRCFLPGAGA